MADNKNKAANKEKETWSVKKWLTTIIIAVLAVLMVSSGALIAQCSSSHDTTYVFGYYNGKPIEFGKQNMFTRQINSSTEFNDAIMNFDINGMYNAWYSAYIDEIVAMGFKELADKAGIVSSGDVIKEVVFTDADGNFDQELYDSVGASEMKTFTTFFEDSYFPYTAVVSDLSEVIVSPNELTFIADVSSKMKSFDYFVVDYNVIPATVVKDYDFSQMELKTDEEGNTIEPTLEEKKAYIYAQDPDMVNTYINAALETAKAANKATFYQTAEEIGSVIHTVEAGDNIGGSSFVNGFNASTDEAGFLGYAAEADSGIYTTLFNAEEGYVTDIINAGDGAYIVARVGEDVVDEYIKEFGRDHFRDYMPLLPVYDAKNQVVTSEKLEDKFSENQWLPSYISQVVMSYLSGSTN